MYTNAVLGDVVHGTRYIASVRHGVFISYRGESLIKLKQLSGGRFLDGGVILRVGVY